MILRLESSSKTCIASEVGNQLVDVLNNTDTEFDRCLGQPATDGRAVLAAIRTGANHLMAQFTRPTTMCSTSATDGSVDKSAGALNSLRIDP